MSTRAEPDSNGLLPAARRLAGAVLPQSVHGLLHRRRLAREATARGLRIERGPTLIDVVRRDGRRDQVLRIAATHEAYLWDLVVSFDYYFGAVQPMAEDGRNLVDYSSPRAHRVVGFDAFPVWFPALAEPLVTTEQYLAFAALEPGMGVLDLGAYAGLTSILFARAVAPAGRVIAVDADPRSAACLEHNLAAWKAHSGHTIERLHGAVWNHDRGLGFSAEGSMGSSAAELVGGGRGTLLQVPSFTLSQIVERCALTRVDFVKCDVEGAEQVVFSDLAFFARFAPRIIVETHRVGGVETTDACMEQLGRHGYRCRRIVQHGVSLPLLECRPDRR